MVGPGRVELPETSTIYIYMIEVNTLTSTIPLMHSTIYIYSAIYIYMVEVLLAIYSEKNFSRFGRL